MCKAGLDEYFYINAANKEVYIIVAKGIDTDFGFWNFSHFRPIMIQDILKS